MRCTAYCTAGAYDLSQIYRYFSKTHQVKRYREALDVELTVDEAIKPLFFFGYGAVVFWGFTEEEEASLLEKIKPFEKSPAQKSEFEDFSFSYGKQSKIIGEEISLGDSNPMTKLAISYAMAQSVKLETFEMRIQKTIETTENIPKDLAARGKISLSKDAIRRKMGALFIERNSINLHLDFLEVPEFFWEHEEYEPAYTMAANYLDIKARVSVLNHKLKIVHELFQMLQEELNHQHSARLEWIIIILIAVEIVLTLAIDVLKWT